MAAVEDGGHFIQFIASSDYGFDTKLLVGKYPTTFIIKAELYLS